MVGKEAKINEFIRKWLYKNYELGKHDCLQLIKDFYNLPDEWNNIDIKNGKYKDIWQENINKAIVLYINFINTYFEKIKKEYKRKGDLVIINNNSFFTVGVYLGNMYYISFNEKKGCYIGKIFTDDYDIYRRK